MDRITRSIVVTSIVAVGGFAVFKMVQFFRNYSTNALSIKDGTETDPDKRDPVNDSVDCPGIKNDAGKGGEVGTSLKKGGEVYSSSYFTLEDDFDDDTQDIKSDTKNKDEAFGSSYFTLEDDSKDVPGRNIPAFSPNVKDDPTNHLVRRFCRFLQIAGIAQYIEDLTKLPRTELFLSADCFPQDQAAKLLINPRDSQPIRIQVGPVVEQTSCATFEALRDFLRQTYVTSKSLKVDTQTVFIEENVLPVLLSFRWDLKDKNREKDVLKTLEGIAETWLGFLKVNIKRGDRAEREEMENAFQIVSNMRPGELLKHVEAGFEYMRNLK